MEKIKLRAIPCNENQASLFGENPPRKPTKKFCAEYEELGRTRLSRNFILRDLLFSTDSAALGLTNFPERPDLVVHAGAALCEKILEPVLAEFGRFAITFGYQSREGIDYWLSQEETRKATSNPHQWDRGTPFGDGVFARIDILPFCVEDGEVSREAFGHWLMHRLDIDLLMQWTRSNVYCITISPQPRRVWVEWGSVKRGEPSNTTHMGADYWQRIYPELPENMRPRFGPSMTEGRMWWSRGKAMK